MIYVYQGCIEPSADQQSRTTYPGIVVGVVQESVNLVHEGLAHLAHDNSFLLVILRQNQS